MNAEPVRHLESSLSRLRADIDERAGVFLNRPLEGEIALSMVGRRLHQAAPRRTHPPVKPGDLGRRDIVGRRIGPSAAEVFWSDFLKELRSRGVHGGKLVISDAHECLKAAISRVMNPTWRRRSAH